MDRFRRLRERRTVERAQGQGRKVSTFAFIVLGMVSGFIASKVVNGSGEGLIVDVLLGVAGAFVGGWAFHLVGQRGVTGFNFWSVFVAVTGSILVLLVYHAIRGRRMA